MASELVAAQERIKSEFKREVERAKKLFADWMKITPLLDHRSYPCWDWLEYASRRGINNDTAMYVWKNTRLFPSRSFVF